MTIEDSSFIDDVFMIDTRDEDTHDDFMGRDLKTIINNHHK